MSKIKEELVSLLQDVKEVLLKCIEYLNDGIEALQKVDLEKLKSTVVDSTTTEKGEQS
jgi:hypothetical protein